MRDLPWPSHPVTARSLTVSPHSRGTVSDTSRVDVARGGGAKWSLQVTFAASGASAAFQLRAFIHRLRGAAGSVVYDASNLVPRVLASYTDGTIYTDGTQYIETAGATVTATADVLRGATTISLSAPLTIGGIFTLSSPSGASQVCRVVSVSGTTVSFRPAARVTYTNPIASIDDAYIKLRLTGNTPSVPIVAGNRSQEVTIEFEEFF